MQKISLQIGCLLIILNVIAYLVFSAYPLINCIVTTIIIVICMALQYAISRIQLKNGFRYSLATLIPIGSVICVTLGITAPIGFNNNINLFVTVVIVSILATLIIIAKKMSEE